MTATQSSSRIPHATMTAAAKNDTVVQPIIEFSNNDSEASIAVSLKPSKAERAFLLRLDVCLISYVWISYCIKQIDSSNYKTAYVSGMKEELKLFGNELNYFDTCYRIGYALCIIPSQLIMTKIRPSVWLPALELVWGVMTGLIAVAQNARLIYAMRFLIGACEASAYPGIISLLMLWYNPSELSKRVAIFGTSYPAANIFVGSMQAALHKGMNGRGGLSGWRWLFIFNALMTVVVALCGFFLVPDSPSDSRAWWLSENHKKIAKRRMEAIGRKGPVGFSFRKAGKTFLTWPLYAFTIAYATWSWSQNSNTWYTLFLKSVKTEDGKKRFSVEQINLIPNGAYCLQMIVMLGFAYVSDRTRQRARWVIVQMVTVIIGCIILSIWPKSFEVKMLGFHILFLSNSAGPILVAWLAEVCTSSAEARAIIIGISVTFVYAIDSFANIFIYPASEAPNYPIGYKMAAVFGVISIAGTLLMKRFDLRDKKLDVERGFTEATHEHTKA